MTLKSLGYIFFISLFLTISSQIFAKTGEKAKPSKLFEIVATIEKESGTFEQRSMGIVVEFEDKKYVLASAKKIFGGQFFSIKVEKNNINLALLGVSFGKDVAVFSTSNDNLLKNVSKNKYEEVMADLIKGKDPFKEKDKTGLILEYELKEDKEKEAILIRPVLRLEGTSLVMKGAKFTVAFKKVKTPPLLVPGGGDWGDGGDNPKKRMKQDKGALKDSV